MKILVAVKRVIDYNVQISVKTDGSGIETDNVIFGSTVFLMDLESNTKKNYKIVGKDEADATKNYIYFRSPIGKA